MAAWWMPQVALGRTTRQKRAAAVEESRSAHGSEVSLSLDGVGGEAGTMMKVELM